jgi:hypothetical protein
MILVTGHGSWMRHRQAELYRPAQLESHIILSLGEGKKSGRSGCRGCRGEEIC